MIQIDFLNPEECKKAVAAVYDLKDHWVNRYMGLPIYTLGAASYLDGRKDQHEQYKLLVKKYNPFLWSHFQFIYEKLAQLLAEEMGKNVMYHPELSLPGFHIFLAHKILERPVADQHFDLQFLKIELPFQKVDFEHPISFTAALELPSQGGGLNYWDMDYNDYKNATKEEVNQQSMTKEKKYLPYEVGKLVIHKKLFLHQIAPGKNLEGNDKRISLQGHGLFCDGELYLYW